MPTLIRRGLGVLRTLVELTRLGLLVSEQRLLNEGWQKDALDDSATIESVGVVTKNRPESLERCVRSFGKNSSQYGRTTTLSVYDNSDDSATQLQNRQALARVAQSLPRCKVLYSNRSQKSRYLKRLAKLDQVPPDVVAFALFDVLGCGLARGTDLNALLLDHVGRRVVTLDDDIVCRLARAPNYESGLAVVSVGDPTECWFYENREAATVGTRFEDADFLALHEDLLGQRVAACVARAVREGDMDWISSKPNLISQFVNPGHCVRVTMTGVIGDSGCSNPIWFTLSGASRNRLLQSKEAYQMAFASRDVARAVRRRTITDGLLFMNYAAGLDNRAMLPPFFPVRRNADGAFAACLRACGLGNHIGYIPWLVFHDPPEVRSGPNFSKRFPDGLSISEIVILALQLLPMPVGSGDLEALRALGKHLSKLSELPLPEFQEVLHRQFCRNAGLEATWLERELFNNPSAPTCWRADIEVYLRRLLEFCKSPSVIVAIDLLEGRPVSEAKELTRTLIGHYGKLLVWWPDLRAASAQLLRSGNGIAEPLI